ncbi:MAG: DUF1206 domain-containing protein [Rhodocyclaceae bacterium]|nr:DUF1206 domain-containing protein [Rhodocyclaceae bacterium]
MRRSRAPGWLVALAKLGYVSRGLVYLIVGALATMRAVGVGGAAADSRDALLHLPGTPLGTGALWLIAAGLVGYAVWRLCQSLLDADGRGRGWQALALRFAFFVSALTHLGLAIFAAWLATDPFSAGSGDGGSSAREWSARALSWPAGPWIVAGAGGLVAAAGASHIKASFGRAFAERFIVGPRLLAWLAPVCKFGLVARGVALLLAGAFVTYAGLAHDPAGAGGLREVLLTLARQPFGMALLGIMGAGLTAFGLYSLFEAAFRRVDGPPM